MNVNDWLLLFFALVLAALVVSRVWSWTRFFSFVGLLLLFVLMLLVVLAVVAVVTAGSTL